MSRRVRAAEKQVIDEARVIHRNGWGKGTTYGLGEAFRELGEAEREARERTKPKRKDIADDLPTVP
jgi:hypothetical protein